VSRREPCRRGKDTKAALAERLRIAVERFVLSPG